MEVMEVSKIHDLCTIMSRTDLCFEKKLLQQSSVTHTKDVCGKNEQKFPDFKEIVLISPHVGSSRLPEYSRILQFFYFPV